MGIFDTPINYKQINNDLRRNQHVEDLVSVATDSAWYDGSPYSAGTNTFLQSQLRHIAVDGCWGLRFVYVNAYQRDTLPTNQLNVRAGIELTGLTGGTTYVVPVYFNGLRDVTMNPGQYAISDPLPVTIPSGGIFWSRTLLTVPSAGGYMPLQSKLTDNTWNEGSETGTSYTDKTTSGTITSVGNASTYGPCMIAGYSQSRHPFVGIDGDSIASGTGDTLPASSTYQGLGFARRALNGTIPYSSTAAGGAVQKESTFYREFMLSRCTDILCEGGINDLLIATTLTAHQAITISLWKRRAATGAKVWQTTITPRTSSTDTWATLGNQTANLPSSNETVRTSYNDWLRDGAPILSGVAVTTGSNAVGTLRAGAIGHPLAGYFETADAVESARNSGKWKVGYVYTGDSLGIHPSPTGHAAMATAVDMTKFTSAI